MSWCLSIKKLNTGGCLLKSKPTNNPLDKVNWLKFAEPAGARDKIRTFLQKKLKLRKIRLKMSKKILKDEIKNVDLMKRNSWIQTYKTYLGAFGARSLDDIFYFIGKKIFQ